jgi:hypothetical protein
MSADVQECIETLSPEDGNTRLIVFALDVRKGDDEALAYEHLVKCVESFVGDDKLDCLVMERTDVRSGGYRAWVLLNGAVPVAQVSAWTEAAFIPAWCNGDQTGDLMILPAPGGDASDIARFLKHPHTFIDVSGWAADPSVTTPFDVSLIAERTTITMQAEDPDYERLVREYSVQDRARMEAKRRNRLAELPKRPLVIEDMIDILNTEYVETPWIIDKLFSTGTFALVVAQHKTGKTTFALNLADALLTGKDFLGFKVAPNYERGVLYLNCDQTKAKLKWYGRALSLSESGRFMVTSYSSHEFDVENEVQMAELEQACSAHNVGVVIIDVWAAVYSGDENASSETRRAVSTLLNLRDNANLDGLILLHHTGWAASVPAVPRHCPIQRTPSGR